MNLRHEIYLIAIIMLNSPFSAIAQENVNKAETPEKLPAVLILGDSISIGYTPYVQEMLKGEARVVRPTLANGAAENCAGTAKGVEYLKEWLAVGDGKWDVIHFNFGIHDLKHVHPNTGENSVDPAMPRQAEPDAYEKQLRSIVAELKSSGAKLIFATTTPVPEGKVNPLRKPEDVAAYNNIAKKVMEENGIAINDLHAFALSQLEKIQLPNNVHFTDEGYVFLGGEVAKHLLDAITLSK